MHRPDHPTALNGQFTDGDPGQGIDATVIQASWLNDGVLEELVNVVEGAGITLSKPDNGQLLEAISALIAAQSGQKNRLLNPEFSVWQVGATQTSSASTWVRTGADGWYMNPQGSTLTTTRTAFSAGQTVVPGFPAYYLELDKSGTPSAQPAIACFVEDIREWSEASVTVSFWAKADSSLNVDLAAIADYGTGSSSPDVVVTQPFTITTAWVRYSHTFTLPTNAAKDIRPESHLRFEWRLPNSGTAATLDLANVQVERGTAVTDFECPDPGEVLRGAERYLEMSWSLGSAFTTTLQSAVAAYWTDGGSGVLTVLPLQRRFRQLKMKTPVVTWYSPDTGAANTIYRPNSDAAVTLTGTGTNPSLASTGYPTISGLSPGADVYAAHWLASAELTF